MLFWSLIILIMWFLLFMGVAFITLLERKVLGLSQNRFGPNKVVIWGLVQPLFDGLKLLLKEFFMLMYKVGWFSFFSPILIIGSFLLMLVVMPWQSQVVLFKYSSIWVFIVLGVSAYAVMMTGWSSLSGFSKLGSMRGLLQSLSYEVAIVLVMMILMKLNSSLILSGEIYSFEMLLLWLTMWLIISLLETNRAPFDLVEGESEMISGFNIELGSIGFVFIFLSEYGMIIVMSLLASWGFSMEVNELSMAFIVFMILIRSCFPRFRYDMMMSFMWMLILPISVWVFIFLVFY